MSHQQIAGTVSKVERGRLFKWSGDFGSYRVPESQPNSIATHGPHPGPSPDRLMHMFNQDFRKHVIKRFRYEIV
jgi:hypothetical protein